MKSLIFLSGGGDSKQSNEINNYLLDELKNIKTIHCLYIPIALKKEYYQSAINWFKNEYKYLTDIDVVLDKSDADKFKKRNYELIYIGGGNTGKLLYELRDYGLDKFILYQLKKGSVVYGGSAGAIVFGKTITVSPEDEFEVDKDNTGFNILGEYSIVPHFESEFSKRHRSEAIKYSTNLLGISESSGVIFKDGKIAKKIFPNGIKEIKF